MADETKPEKTEREFPWFKRFWDTHGDRLIFMGISTIFGICIFYLGHRLGDQKLAGQGIGIIVVVGGLALNKARSKAGNGNGGK